jgi:hypothetical protein
MIPSRKNLRRNLAPEIPADKKPNPDPGSEKTPKSLSNLGFFVEFSINM